MYIFDKKKELEDLCNLSDKPKDKFIGTFLFIDKIGITYLINSNNKIYSEVNESKVYIGDIEIKQLARTSNKDFNKAIKRFVYLFNMINKYEIKFNYSAVFKLEKVTSTKYAVYFVNKAMVGSIDETINKRIVHMDILFNDFDGLMGILAELGNISNFRL